MLITSISKKTEDPSLNEVCKGRRTTMYPKSGNLPLTTEPLSIRPKDFFLSLKKNERRGFSPGMAQLNIEGNYVLT